MRSCFGSIKLEIVSKKISREIYNVFVEGLGHYKKDPKTIKLSRLMF
jgi:hypothetical protein